MTLNGDEGRIRVDCWDHNHMMKNIKFGSFEINLHEIYEEQAYRQSQKTQNATNNMQDVIVTRNFDIDVIDRFKPVIEHKDKPTGVEISFKWVIFEQLKASKRGSALTRFDLELEGSSM